MSEKMEEPKNIPHNWDYQSEFHTVTCAGCSFRYGAEHPDSDGWWTCPNCGNGNNPTRASSPAQEPVTTETVAWRWKVHGIWHYAGGFPVSGAEPLYANPAPPQREEIAEHLYTKFCADPSVEWQDAPEKLKDVWRRYAGEIVALSGEEGKS